MSYCFWEEVEVKKIIYKFTIVADHIANNRITVRRPLAVYYLQSSF